MTPHVEKWKRQKASSTTQNRPHYTPLTLLKIPLPSSALTHYLSKGLAAGL